ncbi:MAG: S1C family serine protease [Opitutales bacterium]
MIRWFLTCLCALAASTAASAQALGTATNAGTSPGAVTTSPALPTDSYLTLQRRLVEVFEQNKRAVVKVFAASERRADSSEEAPRPVQFVGTGFFISREGHVLTNANITLGAERIWIELTDGLKIFAELIGQDPVTNISILRVMEVPEGQHFLRFSDAGAPPGAGTLVQAITCELWFGPAPSFGQVKGIDANYGPVRLPTLHLRTSIPAEGGEGGSPVFDLNGDLIGMITASLPELRSSYVLPARAVNRVKDDILLEGEVSYASFGFRVRQFSQLDGRVQVVIEEVANGSPAEAAGLREGDVIERVAEYAIRRDADLRQASFYLRPDKLVAVGVVREGEAFELPLKLGRREVNWANIEREGGILTAPDAGVASPEDRPSPAEEPASAEGAG